MGLISRSRGKGCTGTEFLKMNVEGKRDGPWVCREQT